MADSIDVLKDGRSLIAACILSEDRRAEGTLGEDRKGCEDLKNRFYAELPESRHP
ncbi:hypothetical protein [Henriciella mobilis]|uniref:hypothetical protein n=1 Tax=Henriciella mobilis TaxID=2305467 RepID=UPI0013140DA3|nr:hypothetical protein [Henriciella mobilis]